MELPPTTPFDGPCTPTVHSGEPLLDSQNPPAYKELHEENHDQEKALLDRIKLALGIGQDSDINFFVRPPETIPPVSDYFPGYGRAAALENSDPNFLICRKFGYLHCRVLLGLQDELHKLERDLQRAEESEFDFGEPLLLKARRLKKGLPGPRLRRQEILAQIHEKLKEYDEMVFRLREIQMLKKPSKRLFGCLYTMIKPNIVDGENGWIRRSDDLVALGQDSEHGWFDDMLANMLYRIPRKWMLGLFRTKEQRIITGTMPALNLVSPERFDVLLKAYLTLVASTLLLAPIIALLELQPQQPYQAKIRTRYQLGVVFLFTVAFSACCMIFTKARKQEIFTATAAYCAVLVVLLGNTSQVRFAGGA